MADGGKDGAVSKIEAALQAALGGDGAARPDLARRALVASGEEQVEAWLESVARELQNHNAALVPADMAEAIAEKIMANRRLSLGAHGRIEGQAITNLVRKS